MTCGDIFLGVLAILFPPLAVWIKRGLCSLDSLLNILLCLLGYLPGLLHSWYIIARFPDPEYEIIRDFDGPENANAAERGQAGGQAGGRNSTGRVTYYYVSREQAASSPSNPSNASNFAASGGAGGVAGTGAPDGGRAHRQIQRGGSNYGTLNAGYGAAGAQGGQGGSSNAGEGVPPSYEQALRGDNKVQTE